MDHPPSQPGLSSEADGQLTGRRYALRFISGKYQGGEFPLYPDREILVGRSSDLDMVLVEDMVSRKHAKISISGEQIFIQDLGSTNGSFVNGEKIRRARLKEGDRVLIGTSIIKVVAVNSADLPADAAQVRQQMAEVSSAQRPSHGRTMTGTIDEVPLPDLLQLFTTSKKTGVLTVRRKTSVGQVYLRDGRLVYACINDDREVQPIKVMYRILTWETGNFDFGPSEEDEFPEEIEEPLEMILMEGMRQIDEIGQLGEVPSYDAVLSIAQPLMVPLRELSPEELDALQLVHNYGHMETVLNKSANSDFETCEQLISLIRKNYVSVDA
jgi:pSer/pThr/pTyr-binding forkhead associated (FHA) protein